MQLNFSQFTHHISSLQGDELWSLSWKMLDLANAMYSRSIIKASKKDIREFIEILRDGMGITPFIARDLEQLLILHEVSNDKEKSTT